MDGAAGGGAGRGAGGRGAALLAAMKNKKLAEAAKPSPGVQQQQPDESQGDTSPVDTSMQSATGPSASLGRGALLGALSSRQSTSTTATNLAGRQALLQRLKVKTTSQAGDSSIPPKPVGRAALVATLKSGPGSSSGGKSQCGLSTLDITQDQVRDIPTPQGVVSPPVGLVSPPSNVAEVTSSMAQTSLAKNEPVVKKGTAGKECKLTANYVRLEVAGEKGMYEFEVRFEPLVDSRDERFKLLNQLREVLGPTKTFDGVCLYLPHELKEKVTVLVAKHPIDQSDVTVTITLKHIKKLADPKSVQFYNTLFRRIMGTLKMVQMNKNFYDPRAGHMVPQHKLEIWPGYVTAVQEFEGGIMLCCDVSHKVLRTQTAHELMKDVINQKSPDVQAGVQKALLGAVILTRYNNKCYRIDDIDWDMSPSSTFVDHNGQEKSFMDYYKKHYNITIKDAKQPMLISRAKRKTAEESDVAKLIALVPELCNLTGLTDQMKADFRVMKDVGQFTRVTPNQRQQALKKFIDNVNNSAEASSILLNWGLKLAPMSVQLTGRIINPEKLLLGKGATITVNAKADWGRESTSNQMLTAVDLKKWNVVYVTKNEAVAQNFVSLMTKLAPKMGMRVAQPDLTPLPNDRTETYLKAIRDVVNPSVQIVVTIMPTPRDDRYSAVKKLCCVEKPVPSQVINFKTISNEKKVSSVVQKVALQINCKLGGELWGCQIPAKMGTIMVIGVDVFHDPSRRGSSIAGVVSSTNMTMSKWFSSTVFQNPGQELVDCLKVAFVKALKKFHDANNIWPDKVIVFRDGVGDSQLSLSASYEAEQFRSSFKHISDKYNPGFCFIVVQKRINTRIFIKAGKELDNPPPGTILDHTVTKRDWYDFFLVSQHVGQGTVSPTHYVVIHDSLELPVDAIQRISYKLTHMYYNWPGTVRVPAPCQYAHKLAYQVGEHISREPSAHLQDRLFFL